MFSRLSLSISALALSAFATPLFAQVTAEELWAEWQAQGLMQGRVLAAESVTPTANGLELNGFSSTYSDDDITIVGRASTLTMTDQSDGTVQVTLPEVYEIEFTFPIDPGDPPGVALLEMRPENLMMVASGTAEDRRYAYTADAISITGAELSGGPSDERPVIEVAVEMETIDATYNLSQPDADTLLFDSSASMAMFSMAASVMPPPDEEGSFKFSFIMSDATTSGSGDLGSILEMTADADAFPVGFDLTSELTYSDLRLEIDFVEPRDGFTVDLSNEGGSFGFAYTDTELTYDVATQGQNFSLTSVDLPMPVDVSIGSSEIVLQLPIAPTDAPAPFMSRIAYQDVTMGESLWAMFDPGAAIPRDPVTVIVDFAGTALITSTLDQIAMGQVMGPPGELRSMSINEVLVSAGGASFSATGDLTFAPGQMIPQPVGTIEMSLTGGNALVQSLAGAGLVPQDQAAMAMGMAGAFARPGPTPDSLETTITFTEGGGITANGIPLQ